MDSKTFDEIFDERKIACDKICHKYPIFGHIITKYIPLFSMDLLPSLDDDFYGLSIQIVIPVGDGFKFYVEKTYDYIDADHSEEPGYYIEISLPSDIVSKIRKLKEYLVEEFFDETIHIKDSTIVADKLDEKPSLDKVTITFTGFFIIESELVLHTIITYD